MKQVTSITKESTEVDCASMSFADFEQHLNNQRHSFQKLSHDNGVLMDENKKLLEKNKRLIEEKENLIDEKKKSLVINGELLKKYQTEFQASSQEMTSALLLKGSQLQLLAEKYSTLKKKSSKS